MEIEYKLSKEDYIEFQLFASTKSETIKRSKKRARNRVPIIYIILGTILLLFADVVIAIGFYLIGILWYLFYPNLTKRRYIKHYTKYVDENFKNRFETNIKVNFPDNYELIETIDIEGESNFKTSEIEKIFEIKRYIYVKMKSGSHLIIPKYKIESIDSLRIELKNISELRGFGIETDLDLNFEIEK